MPNASSTVEMKITTIPTKSKDTSSRQNDHRAIKLANSTQLSSNMTRTEVSAQARTPNDSANSIINTLIPIRTSPILRRNEDSECYRCPRTPLALQSQRRKKITCVGRPLYGTISKDGVDVRAKSGWDQE